MLFLLISALWLATTPVCGFCPSSCLCDEFYPSVTCTKTGLNVVPTLLNPGLRRLNLGFNSISTINEVLSYYELLEELDLSHNSLHSVERGSFKVQRNLYELNLSHNNISELETESLSSLISLSRLDLSHNHITYVPPKTLNNNLNLKVLLLSHNKLHSLTAQTFRGLSKLLVLDLCGNFFRKIPKFALRELENLENLHMCRNRLSRIGNNDLTNEKLKYLSLLSNSISDIDPNGFKKLFSLLQLNINDNWLERVPTETFKHLKSLESLHLSRNKILNLGENAFKGLSSLLILEISRSSHLKMISERSLQGCGNLSSLILSHNTMMKRFPEKLLLNIASLKTLDLRANGLETLSENAIPWRSLKSLDIRDNPFVCNCSLRWLGDLLNTPNKSAEVLDVKCFLPATVKGIYISRVTVEQMMCVDKVLQLILIIIIITLSIILIIGLLLLLCRYHKRPEKLYAPSCDWSNGPLHPAQTWVPNESRTSHSHIVSDDYYYHTFSPAKKVVPADV